MQLYLVVLCSYPLFNLEYQLTLYTYVYIYIYIIHMHTCTYANALQGVSDVTMVDASDASALPSQPQQIASGSGGSPAPPVVAPTSGSDINYLAAGLMQLQATAFANNKHFVPPASDEWSHSALRLMEFLGLRRHGSLAHAAAIVDYITSFPPWQWRQPDYNNPIKNHMRKLQKLQLADTNFIADMFEVQTLWMWCLNHHIETRDLGCRCVVQGKHDGAHKLAFQAQGLTRGTKYAKVSHETHARDNYLLDKLGDWRQRR